MLEELITEYVPISSGTMMNLATGFAMGVIAAVVVAAKLWKEHR